VIYKLEGLGVFQEIITSHPFVCFTIRKGQRERPRATALNPSFGYANSEEEIWIKGSGFNENVEVTFDGVPSTIIEVKEGLLTVKPPKKEGITSEIAVPVIVSNISMSEKFSSDIELTYIFKPNR